jgi:hypothetical protein
VRGGPERRHPALVIPAKAASTPRLSIEALASLEYWIVRSSRMMTANLSKKYSATLSDRRSPERLVTWERQNPAKPRSRHEQFHPEIRQ